MKIVQQTALVLIKDVSRRRALSLILRDHGLRVHEAASDEEAIASTAKNQIDILIILYDEADAPYDNGILNRIIRNDSHIKTLGLVSPLSNHFTNGIPLSVGIVIAMELVENISFFLSLVDLLLASNTK